MGLGRGETAMHLGQLEGEQKEGSDLGGEGFRRSDPDFGTGVS